MRVLITGCHGLLGRKLIISAPRCDRVYGADLSSGSDLDVDEYVEMDITDRDKTCDIIQKIRPDWILNAAAYTDVDGAEKNKELCWRVNVDGVENLCHAVSRSGARLVHISTDYVFDGKSGPYSEEARPNPLGYYGRSKLAGENVLIGSSCRFAIIRTMILYGHAPGIRPNFVTWLIEKLKRQEPVRIVTDQYGNTTLADELALGIWHCVEHDFTGILNIAGREITDRLTFAVQVAQVFQLDHSLISPVTTVQLNQAAPRPLNSGLVVEKALQMGIDLSDGEGALQKFKRQYWQA
jgi:dTDP-4-dehydrorhamnose reductase